MKKYIVLFSSLVVLSCLTACAPTINWHERKEPTTDEERKLILEHVAKLLSTTPQSLAGDDQDWEDAIAEAHRRAKEIACKTTYWEYIDGRPTGRWRYAEEIKSER
jgi:hypothetical protein